MKLYKNRKIRSEARMFPGYGMGRVVLRYDDECRNGHNTFSITVDARDFGGCMHEALAEVFPEYAHLIKWHLTSDDGPLHYIANTVYWAKNGNLEYARKSAVAPRMSLAALTDETKLRKRLPNLMKQFHKTMDSITWPEDAI